MNESKTNSSRNSPDSVVQRAQADDVDQQYRLVSPGMPADLRIMTQNDKDQLVHALRTRKVKTITELRRIEKVFADYGTSDVTEPMTSAWRYYVDSHNMLSELRGLTPNYPFSSECLDEAKRLVIADPNSGRSWNFCWLILVKIATQNLVAKHAMALASKRSTWGTVTPTASQLERLISLCSAEWTAAVRQMLRHWDKPPTTTGN